jgi:hypothetical protein
MYVSIFVVHYQHLVVKIVKIRFRVRMLFRWNEHLTSPATTRLELIKGHKVRLCIHRPFLVHVSNVVCCSGLTYFEKREKATRNYVPSFADMKACSPRNGKRNTGNISSVRRWSEHFLSLYLCQISKPLIQRHGKTNYEIAPSSQAPTSAPRSSIDLCHV